MFLFIVVAATAVASPGDIAAPFVFFVGVRNFLTNDDSILDDHPCIKFFVPIQETPLSSLRNVNQDPPCHRYFISCMGQGVVFIVRCFDQAAVKSVPWVIGTDFRFPNNYVVGSRAFYHHYLTLWG